MSLRATPLLLVALLLALPPVQATGNVTFTPGDSVRSVSAAPGTPVTVTLSYTLDLDVHGDVRLLSLVLQGGESLEHDATWSSSDFPSSQHSARTESASVDDLPLDRSIPITIQFTLPSGTAAGTYDVNAYVTQRVPGANGATFADSATANTRLVLDRPAGGGGGGGGGGSSSSIGAITGFSAHAVESTSLHLGWNALSGSSVVYEVYRSLTAGTEPSTLTLLGSTTQTDFADQGLTPATTYHYRVRGTAGGSNGPFSAELAVKTLPGPDTAAPGMVTGLRVTKVTSGSVALAWSAATDDRGVIAYNVFRGAPGFTPSISNQVTSTSALVFTDTTVAPSTTYAYVVRAADAAGHLGPASAAVQAQTSDIDRTAPVITRVVVVDVGNGWRLQWVTDEPATATVMLSGPSGQRTLNAAEAVTFSSTLGDLPLGTHTFTISATGDSGLTGRRDGRFVVEAGLHGRLEYIGDAMAVDLSMVLGTTVDGFAVYFADVDDDGTVDRLVDASGVLEQERAFPDQRRFLLAVGGTSVLVGADGAVDPVERVTAEVLDSATGEAVHRVTVRVADKAGWIVASLDDPSPSRPLLGIEREDGTPLPAGSAWRDGSGRVRFLDDPEQEYVLLYDNAAGASAASDKESGAGGIPGWLPYVAGAVGIALGMLVMAVLLRRRPPAA